MNEGVYAYAMQPPPDWKPNLSVESDLVEYYDGPFIPWEDALRMHRVDRLVDHGKRSKLGRRCRKCLRK